MHHPASTPARQRGFTLIELMTALGLGLLVVLAATAMLLNVKNTYLSLHHHNQLQETGRYALEQIARALRQTHHLPWEHWLNQQRNLNPLPPALYGVDDSRGSANPDPERPSPARRDGINGSDLLMIGYFGSGQPADDTIFSCGTGGMGAPSSLEPGERGWTVFSVATGRGNEPELRCQYRGKNGIWSSDAIARGVENLQFLFALDSDGDGIPEQLLAASQLSPAQWQQVVAVRIALLVRTEAHFGGRTGEAKNARPREHDLFGSDYSRSNPGDTGSRFSEPREDGRTRQVFSRMVWLRNPPAGLVLR
ncbi:PilW family protein [Herbaspirillum lusitanum]|uniref:PilW family protein n=1 Tax=Herbaspirillum lusitanum TaxID=213312 RepID=A0ABW9A633_9BURK